MLDQIQCGKRVLCLKNTTYVKIYYQTADYIPPGGCGGISLYTGRTDLKVIGGGDAMYRFGNFVLSWIFAFLICAYTVYGFDYEACEANIPVSFINRSEHTHRCMVRIEPLSGSPAPDAAELDLEDSEKKSFVVKIDAPGLYKYKLYRKEGDESGVIYDNTLYYADILVTCVDNSNVLSSDITITVDNGGKSEAVVFSDRGIAGDNTGKDSKDRSRSKDEIKGGSVSIRVYPEENTEVVSEDHETHNNENTENHTEKTTEENTEENTEKSTALTDENGSDPEPDKNGRAPNHDNGGESTDETVTAVETGDDNHQGLWCLAMIFSAAAYASSAILEKRQKGS